MSLHPVLAKLLAEAIADLELGARTPSRRV
jgi:hypothetical protein